MVIATKYKQVCRLQLYGDDDLYSNNSNSVYSLPGPLLGNPTIVSGGTGYNTLNLPNVVFTGGGGSGATATAVILSGAISAITMTNYGNGYTFLPSISFTYSVINYSGLTGGSNYTVPPLISFSGGGGGSGAAATCTISSGAVNAITITNIGSGYTSTPTIVFTSSGTVTNYTNLIGGTGFTSAPTISFSGGGGGSGAAATCTVTAGSVTAISITNNGSGYTSPPLIIFSGNGTISNIIISTGGSGYYNAPSISFSGGGGTGATATCTVLYGVVNTITVTSNGTGYTSVPTVLFTPTNGGTGATGVAVIGGGAYATAVVSYLGSGAAATATMNGSGATATAVGCVINSKKMRFGLNNSLSHIQLSNNARCIVEMCNIPSITNWAGKSIIIRLGCATRDNVLDTKKFLSGNPILLSYALSTTTNSPNILFNCSEFFYNINVPSNFLQIGYIDLELECPTATTASTLIGIQPPLSTFYINLVIVDEDLEQTKDNALAPQINYALNTNNFNRGKLYN